jgi:hypothetical protein
MRMAAKDKPTLAALAPRELLNDFFASVMISPEPSIL